MTSLETCLSVKSLSFENQLVERSSHLSYYIPLSRVTKEGFLTSLNCFELLSFCAREAKKGTLKLKVSRLTNERWQLFTETLGTKLEREDSDLSKSSWAFSEETDSSCPEIIKADEPGYELTFEEPLSQSSCIFQNLKDLLNFEGQLAASLPCPLLRKKPRLLSRHQKFDFEYYLEPDK